MRKMMTKEVTFTTVKVAKMEMVEGIPTAVSIPDEVILGNVNSEQATKAMRKKHGENVSVFLVIPQTQTYEMAVEDFIKVANVKEVEPEIEPPVAVAK
jgi:mannose/fructose/N-acetylgalactosamine-specific phosphotransferase system component IIB